mgnify:CR=1 FL=1
MSKKIFLISIFSVVLFSVLLSPSIVLAQCTGGLVPCGRSCDVGTPNEHCTLCHVFILIKRIIDFLSVVAAAILVVMVFVGAIIFITAHGSPELITKGRQTLTAAIVGFIIVLSSWIIVNTIVVFASGNSAGEVFGKPWNQIECNPGSTNTNTTTTNNNNNTVVAERVNRAELRGDFNSYGVFSATNDLSKNTHSLLAIGGYF